MARILETKSTWIKKYPKSVGSVDQLVSLVFSGVKSISVGGICQIELDDTLL